MILFETLSQPLLFLILFSIGFCCGFLFDLRSYIVFLLNKNKVAEIILDVLFSVGTCAIFFFSCLRFNYGELRFFLILAFVSGFLIQRFSLGRLIAKVIEKCYIKFRNLISKIDYGKLKKKKKQKNIDN